MARKRQRMRRDPHTFQDGMNQGHHAQPEAITADGKFVKVHQISKSDEGVLYTHRISNRPPRPKKSLFAKFFSSQPPPKEKDDLDRISSARKIEDDSAPPQSETLRATQSVYGDGSVFQKQFTVTRQKKYRSSFLNWMDSHHLIFDHDVDAHFYRPSTLLYRYINWTFYATFTGVFVSFLLIFYGLCILFAGFLYVAGNAHPDCITVAGQHFDESPYTRFGDAFSLSWTTFTTVGYGMTYTGAGGDLEDDDHPDCSAVVFLATVEAFLGLIYAGMCGAILFGKVNRIQSHAKLTFSNAVCLQYEEVDPEDVEDYDDDEDDDDDDGEEKALGSIEDARNSVGAVQDVENPITKSPSKSEEDKVAAFVDQFNGCPVLKFQVVNELCNREGSEIVDSIMKVIGIKFGKGRDGKITHSQYVRVNLVDFEHPFFSRVWHGVHILDGTSPLLTYKAKRKIQENGGSWPSEWFHPEVIKRKLEFNDLIVTVAGISNVSAVTVHAYKRYKIGDILIGFNFAPLVYRDVKSGKLQVDMTLVHDVREQQGGGGEDLQKNLRKTGLAREMSTIDIKNSGDALGGSTSHSSRGSRK